MESVHNFVFTNKNSRHVHLFLLSLLDFLLYYLAAISIQYYSSKSLIICLITVFVFHLNMSFSKANNVLDPNLGGKWPEKWLIKNQPYVSIMLFSRHMLCILIDRLRKEDWEKAFICLSQSYFSFFFSQPLFITVYLFVGSAASNQLIFTIIMNVFDR